MASVIRIKSPAESLPGLLRKVDEKEEIDRQIGRESTYDFR